MTKHTGWYRLDRHNQPDPAPAPGAPDPAPNPTPTPGPDPSQPVDVSSLPPNVQKLIAELRTENGKHRTDKNTATQAQAAAEQRLADVLKAAGLNPDGSQAANPEQMAAKLAERVDAAEARVWTLGVKDAVYTQAADAGVNAKLVYSSNDFRDTLDDLVDQDPESPTVRAAILTKMQEFVAANPEYAATSAGPTGPRPDPGQGTRPPVVTDFKDADRDTFAKEARKYGIRPRTY